MRESTRWPHRRAGVHYATTRCYVGERLTALHTVVLGETGLYVWGLACGITNEEPRMIEWWTWLAVWRVIVTMIRVTTTAAPACATCVRQAVLSPPPAERPTCI
jgi:hypothetical protein